MGVGIEIFQGQGVDFIERLIPDFLHGAEREAVVENTHQPFGDETDGYRYADFVKYDFQFFEINVAFAYD